MAAADARARPIITPVRSITGAGARRSGRLISACSAAARGVRPQAALRAAHAGDPVRLDVDVADLAGVAAPAAEQPAVADDPGLDGIGEQQHHHVGGAARRADPPLGDHPRLRRRRQHRRQPGQLVRRDRGARSRPGRHVQRHHRAVVLVDRALARDPAREQRPASSGRAATTRRISRCSAGQTSRAGRGDPVAHQHLAVVVDDPGGEAIVADVDREVHRARRGLGGRRWEAAPRHRRPTVAASAPAPYRAPFVTSPVYPCRSECSAQPSSRPPRRGTGRRQHPLRRAVRRDHRQHRPGRAGQAAGDRARRDVPARRGPPPHRGRAGRRQDQPRQGDGHVDRLHVEAGPVHPRPAAGRPRRRQRVPAQHRAVPLPARPALRQHRPRRRDQPGLAEDAVGAARGDGGAPDHRRRRRATCSRRRSW